MAQSECVIPYFPHDKQRPFHQDRYKYKYRLISAGTGSGKTYAGVWEILSWLIDDNPGCVAYIFEPTYRMVRRILIPTFERLLGFPLESNPLVEDFKRTENRIDFIKGSRLWFGGLENPEMAEGPNIDVIQVDEARLIRHFDVAWRVIQRRIRGSVPGKYPVGAFVTTTPDMPGSVLHQFFEDPKKRNPNSKVYRFSIDDNPYLPKDYIESIKRSHHGGLAERFVHGRFAAIGAGTVPFDYTKHVVENVETEFLKQIVYGVDFGWHNPSCILAVGFDRDDTAFVLEEYYQARETQDTILKVAKEMRERWGNGKFYCDPTVLQTIEWLKNHGLQAVKNEPKRGEGIREMAGRFKIIGDEPPRILVHSSCVNLIAELQVYDESVKENDHATDALRYALGSKMKKRGGSDAWAFG